jgi:uncharacterized protein (UPF0548 family)
MADDPLTYDEVGATSAARLPAGYHHERARIEVGRGEVAWQRACDALRTWQAHRGAGMSIGPAGARLVAGTVVVTVARIGPMFVLAPCRIVYVTDESGRFGFAYGTLPGHPERGEEAFHVVADAEEAVSFEIVAVSRPASSIVRLGAPLARSIQRAATRRYLNGVASHVAREPSARTTVSGRPEPGL